MEFDSVRYFDPRARTGVSGNRLPHWEQDGRAYFLTFRLADSLPQSFIERWNCERDVWIANHPKPWDEVTEEAYQRIFSADIERELDRGYGSCVLAEREAAGYVSEALMHFDGERYDMLSFVVMPNHVHVVFSGLAEGDLKKVVQSWKRHSAWMINRRAGKWGNLWQKDYFDRIVRDESHLYRCMRYIRNNPGKAGIAEGRRLLFEGEMAKRMLG